MRRKRAIITAATVALGVATAIITIPAFAATTPTISAPAQVTGYTQVTISGKADPGATVELYEAAYAFRTDMYQSEDFDNGGFITAKADGSGNYSMKRYVDSGFVFAVEAGGARSQTITVKMQATGTFTAASTSSGTVQVHLTANPGQPWLPVSIQRQNGTAWTTVASGNTSAESATFAATLTGQPGPPAACCSPRSNITARAG
jgi:hypothetical protein